MKKLPTYLTTVTPLSKILALILFILLPFVGFYLGMQYQKMSQLQTKSDVRFGNLPKIGTKTNQSIEKNLTNTDITFSYPTEWSVIVNESNHIVMTKQVEGANASGTTSTYTSTVTINIISNSATNIQDIFTAHYITYDEKMNSILNQTAQHITVDGEPAIYINHLPGAGGYDGEGLVFQHNGKIYDMELHGWTNDTSDFKQMYSTIRFINTIPSPISKSPNMIVCTQDAKMCPDGSYVSRTGPNCEFAPCKKMEP